MNRFHVAAVAALFATGCGGAVFETGGGPEPADDAGGPPEAAAGLRDCAAPDPALGAATPYTCALSVGRPDLPCEVADGLCCCAWAGLTAPGPDAAPTPAQDASAEASSPEGSAEAAGPEAGADAPGEAAPDAGPPPFLGCVIPYAGCFACAGASSCAVVCGKGIGVTWAGGECSISEPGYSGAACASGTPCNVNNVMPGESGYCSGTCG